MHGETLPVTHSDVSTPAPGRAQTVDPDPAPTIPALNEDNFCGTILGTEPCLSSSSNRAETDPINISYSACNFGSGLKARSKRSDQEVVRIRDPIAVSTVPSRLKSLGALGDYSGWLSLVIADTPHFSQTRSIFATQLFWFTTLKPFGR